MKFPDLSQPSAPRKRLHEIGDWLKTLCAVILLASVLALHGLKKLLMKR
jgi:hypothetical protein